MVKTARLDKTEKAFLREELREYMLAAGDLTADEKTDLRRWVSDGNSCYDNPCLLCDESGRPMDFISGCRTNDDMRENPSDYFFGEPGGTCGEEEEIPF